mmetsp:Transcript_32810/g.79822  ORF Transcript_32810/g.79822 Transcript_32810/m.79822 type:complete len:263 (+) Transcript_32810:42-830(+)
MSACQLTKLSPQSQLNQPVSQQEQNRQQTAPRPRLDIQSQPLRPPKLEHQTTHLPLDEALYFRTSAPPSGCGKFRTGCPKSHATVARLSNRIKTLGKPESQCKKNLLTCKAAESTTTRDRGSTSSTTIKPTSRCDNLLETNRRWPQRKSQLEQLCGIPMPPSSCPSSMCPKVSPYVENSNDHQCTDCRRNNMIADVLLLVQKDGREKVGMGARLYKPSAIRGSVRNVARLAGDANKEQQPLQVQVQARKEGDDHDCECPSSA